MNIIELDSHRQDNGLTPRERAHMRLMTACSRLNEVSMCEVDDDMLDDVRRLLGEVERALNGLER